MEIGSASTHCERSIAQAPFENVGDFCALANLVKMRKTLQV